MFGFTPDRISAMWGSDGCSEDGAGAGAQGGNLKMNDAVREEATIFQL